MRHAESKAGFSLVSVMIAMVLLGIGVVALSSASVYVLAVQTESSVRSAATAIASSYMEEVKARDPETIDTEDPVRVNEAGEADPNGAYVRKLEVSTDTGFEETKELTVTVDYRTGRGRSGTVKLVTIIYTGSLGAI